MQGLRQRAYLWQRQMRAMREGAILRAQAHQSSGQEAAAARVHIPGAALGKCCASHPEAIARREIRKADARASRQRVEDDKRRQKAAFIASHPWFDPALPRQERYRMRYRLDPEFKLKETLRAQLKKKRNGRSGNWAYSLRRALASNGVVGVPSMERFLGFTIADLHVHIERQFTKDMTWQRFLDGDIHIDHIRPLASFDLFDDDDVRQAWSMTNLRPMWAVDNIKKSAKILHLL